MKKPGNKPDQKPSELDQVVRVAGNLTDQEKEQAKTKRLTPEEYAAYEKLGKKPGG